MPIVAMPTMLVAPGGGNDMASADPRPMASPTTATPSAYVTLGLDAFLRAASGPYGTAGR
ncbi:hypothetical protein GCM10022220_55290 [Actinocatenispora rupis]|uniref:Uncharacterized protein n=1 Tax=Actinocatenispora rupis TaxID=519421 RepID=A0A8J3J5M1_9ACTN|nr:hypothetical protein Aru02nite_54620 [Actinocatenispora rupis]